MKRALIIAFVLLAAAGGLIWWLVFSGPEKVTRTLQVSGHIEATETDLSFKVQGKIAAIHFHEGDLVKEGDVVADLEAQDLRDDVALAEAQTGAAQANLTKLLVGSRPQEIREAKAAVAQAKADLHNKKLDWERTQALFEQGVVAASARDSAQAAYRVAEEACRQALERYRLVKIGPRQEDIDAAREELKRSRASLELARTRLGYATLIAPVDGVVLVREAEPGEVAQVGSPVITTGDLARAYLEAYIPETDLARVHYRQKAVVTTDTYPGKQYPAWVSFIASQAEFTPKTVETKQERVSLVYRTKIRVENPNFELKPGMPADGVIFLDSGLREP